MSHVRAHIRINATTDIEEFVVKVRGDGTANKYTIEDKEGKRRVSAISSLGIVYAMLDFQDEMYFVNDTADGVFPSCIDAYRV